MITFSLSVKIKWSKGKSQAFFFFKNQVLEPMRDLKQPIFIKSDKITKKSLDFYFYFHIYCHRHHRQMNLRIWCSWCSIADFSSVCTGSSPVIRYLHYIVRYRCLQILFSDCYCVVWGFRFVTTLLSLWESLVEMHEQREILGEREF